MFSRAQLWHFANVDLAVQGSPDVIDEEDIYEQLFKQTKEEYRKYALNHLPRRRGKAAI